MNKLKKKRTHIEHKDGKGTLTGVEARLQEINACGGRGCELSFQKVWWWKISALVRWFTGKEMSKRGRIALGRRELDCVISRGKEAMERERPSTQKRWRMTIKY